MNNDNFVRVNPESSIRIKFGSSQKEVDVTGHFCDNPDCPCRDAILYFYEANGLMDKKLFRITLNYETWQIESTEAFSEKEDCPKLIHEFMAELSDEFKSWIISAKDEALPIGDVIREDIDYSDISIDSMVYYSEIYHSVRYNQLTYEFEGTIYFVMDYYCVNPRCDCKDVLLTFQAVKNREALDAPVLELRLSLNSGEYKIEKKSISILRSEILSRNFLNSIKREGVKLFEERYYRIKKWGAEYLINRHNDLLPQSAPTVPPARKIGRNEPCPCDSGKKYKRCCGA